MNIVDALKAVKDEGKLAYRKEWLKDPILNDSGIIWLDKYGYCYWYKNAPVPEKYQDDDPRIGVDIDSLTISNIMAEDWEVEGTWRTVKHYGGSLESLDSSCC